MTLRAVEQTKYAVVIVLCALKICMPTRAIAQTWLQPCPDSPNCVSSLSNDSYQIDPFVITGDGVSAMARLQRVLGERADTTIITLAKTYVTVEFRTALGFIDDASFILEPAGNVIHVRSASRSGYWDLGKNRRRLEEIRREFFKGD